MSITNIIQALEHLVDIHHRLLKRSREKTELIKDRNVEQLQQLIVQERKFILHLEQAEKKRQAFVKDWFLKQGKQDEEMTISNLLMLTNNKQEQKKLAKVTTALTEVITELKRQEQLNRELLEQSMQFVQMSLNMLSPSYDQMNYGANKRNKQIHSVFDSKA